MMRRRESGFDLQIRISFCDGPTQARLEELAEETTAFVECDQDVEVRNVVGTCQLEIGFWCLTRLEEWCGESTLFQWLYCSDK
jgi:hypothetical protein